jgi:hypothetical protein
MWNQLAADYLHHRSDNKTIPPIQDRVMRSLAYEGSASLKDRPRCPDVGVKPASAGTERHLTRFLARREYTSEMASCGSEADELDWVARQPKEQKQRN